MRWIAAKTGSPKPGFSTLRRCGAPRAFLILTRHDLNPDHPFVHNELGIVQRKTGRFAEAKRSYEAALAVYPGYHHARRNLGVLCDLYLADPECALANYEAYMTTVPADDQVAMWIADLRMRLGRQE